MLGGCHQSDDIVATLTGANASDASDSSLPPIDVTVPPSPPEASIDRDAPPVVIDVSVPPVDVTVVDVVPPPIDVVTPPGCDNTGPILSIQRVNGSKNDACAGQLAAHTFTYALCSCEDLSITTTLSTVSFDSSATDKSAVLAGAPVGIGGSYPALGSRIGGSLTVAGSARTPVVPNSLEVMGDLRFAGSATFTQLYVKRDAWLASRVGYFGYVSVGRTLYTSPPLGGFQGIGTKQIPATVSKAFTIDDPCECAGRLDVVAMETDGAAKNDNAAKGIDPALLTNVNTTVKLDLTCARYRFDAMSGSASGSIQLHATGRTAIFVDGNVDLSAVDFQLTVDADAEVDWFIRGNLVLGSAKIGDITRPSAARIYVGGSADIAMSTAVSANLYAPTANVNISSTSVSGSVYGKNLNVQVGTIVGYDRAILNQGNKCDQPTACDKCHTCNGGLACVNGACGACSSDDDCCTPLVCDQGACTPLLK